MPPTQLSIRAEGQYERLLDFDHRLADALRALREPRAEGAGAKLEALAAEEQSWQTAAAATDRLRSLATPAEARRLKAVLARRKALISELQSLTGRSDEALDVLVAAARQNLPLRARVLSASRAFEASLPSVRRRARDVSVFVLTLGVVFGASEALDITAFTPVTGVVIALTIRHLWKRRAPCSHCAQRSSEDWFDDYPSLREHLLRDLPAEEAQCARCGLSKAHFRAAMTEMETTHRVDVLPTRRRRPVKGA